MWKKIDEIMAKLPASTVKKIPNTLTSIRVLSSIGIVAVLLTNGLSSPLMLGSWFAITGLTDVLDGKLARRYNCQSELGGVLDALADKILNWGVGITLIGIGVVPIWSLTIGIRDIIVGVENAKLKIDHGKIRRKKENNHIDRLKELKANFDKGDSIPPTILGKIKMWTQTSAVTSAIFFSATPLAPLTTILFVTTILIATADIFLNAKKIKEKREIINKEIILDSKIEYQNQKEEQKTSKTKSKCICSKDVYQYVESLSCKKEQEHDKIYIKKNNS